MNAALLIGAAAIVVPIVVMETRRKLRDWRDRAGQSAVRRDCWEPALVVVAERGAVWIGYDHGSDAYAGDGDCAAGNAGDVSTSDAGCGGGDA